MCKPQAESLFEDLAPGAKEVVMVGAPGRHRNQVSPSPSTLRKFAPRRVSHPPIPRFEFNGSHLGSDKSIIPKEILKIDRQTDRQKLFSGQLGKLNWEGLAFTAI